MEKVSIALRKVPVGIIKLYQTLLSPMLGPTCRFHPSCSHYAVDAITEHGMDENCSVLVPATQGSSHMPS